MVDGKDADFTKIWRIFTKLPVGDRFFIDCILEDRPAFPNFYDGFKVQEVIDAAVQSDMIGGWVSVG
jgi:hypothetical protein